MDIALLHLADTHIGVENYGRLDAGTGLHTRLQDFVRSLGHILDRALAEKVDLVVFSGDAYRSCDPSPTHQREFATLLRRVCSSGVPVVLVPGNHDTPAAFGRASSLDIYDALRIDGVHVASEPQLLVVDTVSGSIQVACVPWLHRSRLAAKVPYQGLSDGEMVEALQELGAQIIAGLASQIDPEMPAVLAAHLTAADAAYSGTEQTAIIGRDPVFLTSTLANPAFDYVALGHIHRFQDLNAGAVPPVVYPGSVERIDFGEESDAKGACLVTIREEPGGGPGPCRRSTSYRFIQAPARPFVTLEVDIPEGQDPTQSIVDRVEAHTLSDAVVRVIYSISGEGDTPVDLRAVRRALGEAFFVAGIVPRPKASARARRADVGESMALGEALGAYVRNNPQLTDMEEELQAYAARLEQERVGGEGQ